MEYYSLLSVAYLVVVCGIMKYSANEWHLSLWTITTRQHEIQTWKLQLWFPDKLCVFLNSERCKDYEQTDAKLSKTSSKCFPAILGENWRRNLCSCLESLRRKWNVICGCFYALNHTLGTWKHPKVTEKHWLGKNAWVRCMVCCRFR